MNGGPCREKPEQGARGKSGAHALDEETQKTIEEDCVHFASVELNALENEESA